MKFLRRPIAGALPGAVLLACVALEACRQDVPTSADRRAIVTAADEVTVSATDPSSAPQDTTLDVAVFGSGFDRGSRADFALDGVPSDKVRTNSTKFANPKKLIANITIAADAVPDRYDVIVTTSQGKRGIGIELFEVRLKSGRGGSGETALYTIVLTGDIQNDPAHPMTGIPLDPANPFASLSVSDAWLLLPSGGTAGNESVCDDDGRTDDLGRTVEGFGGFAGIWRGEFSLTRTRVFNKRKQGGAHISYLANQQDADGGYMNGVVNNAPVESTDLNGNPTLTFVDDRWWIGATSWFTDPNQPDGVDRCVTVVVTAVRE